jgi:hypothetical protein
MAGGWGYGNCGKLDKKTLRRVFHSSHSPYYYLFQERGKQDVLGEVSSESHGQERVRSVKRTQSRRRL